MASLALFRNKAFHLRPKSPRHFSVSAFQARTAPLPRHTPKSAPPPPKTYTWPSEYELAFFEWYSRSTVDKLPRDKKMGFKRELESRRKRQDEWIMATRHQVRRDFPHLSQARIERKIFREDLGRVWKNWSLLPKIIVGNIFLLVFFLQYRLFSWFFDRYKAGPDTLGDGSTSAKQT